MQNLFSNLHTTLLGVLTINPLDLPIQRERHSGRSSCASQLRTGTFVGSQRLANPRHIVMLPLVRIILQCSTIIDLFDKGFPNGYN